MARIGYARVSTVGQNLDMQITALENSKGTARITGCIEVYASRRYFHRL